MSPSNKLPTLIVRALLTLTPLLWACHGGLSWVPDANGHLMAIHNEQVRIPGLEYLSLGIPRRQVLTALATHGFDCDTEASTSHTQACIRTTGNADPAGGEIVLEFENAYLSGVQAQLQPPGDDSGKLTGMRYEQLASQWTRVFGHPVEARRAGITAARYNLHNGTVLLLVRYDDEPTLLAEHLQIQDDQTPIPGKIKSR